jgi:tetratricopeptide (TPR) repeat protein
VVGLETLVAAVPVRNARLTAGVFICALVLLASGCTTLFPQTAELRNGMPQGVPEMVELKQVPFFPQEEYQCGPAALATILVAAGAKVTPEQLVPQVYLPERKGSLQVEMLAAARRHGMVSYLLAPRFEDLLREIAAGNPVITLEDYSPFGTWHYAVAVGYNYDKGNMILRSGAKEREEQNFPIYELLWRRSGYWAMVALPPDRIPATAEEERWLTAIAALEHAGDARNARIAYETFLHRWPANTKAEIGLANSQHAVGDLRGAEHTLREAARRKPDDVIVLNNLAQTLSDQNRDEEALPFIERAAAVGGPYAETVQDTRRAIVARVAAKRKN